MTWSIGSEQPPRQGHCIRVFFGMNRRHLPDMALPAPVKCLKSSIFTTDLDDLTDLGTPNWLKKMERDYILFYSLDVR